MGRAMEQELRAAVEEMRRHVETSAAETRRHFDVVGEALRGDIRLVAEGVTGLSQRVDRLEANLREEILRAQRELSAMMRFSYAELDRKIQTLEQRVSELGQQYAVLEGRLQRLETTR
ncbi:MAG: hypothetical protein HYV62_01705 [Candidatus Rokubacteria bacterium]|nr:hypothetical protein [Candidatus Rokubacteria bacterium]